MCRFACVGSLNEFVWFSCDSLCDVVWSVCCCLRVVVCVVAVAYYCVWCFVCELLRDVVWLVNAVLLLCLCVYPFKALVSFVCGLSCDVVRGVCFL